MYGFDVKRGRSKLKWMNIEKVLYLNDYLF